MERAEAIKIIKSATVYTPEETEALETLIPELRGNEDERIIRAIIDALYSHTNSINLLSSRGYQMGDIEAWLEKQKEASKAIEAVDRIDKCIDEHLANAHDMKDSDPDKKYYRGWDDALGKMSGILQDVYSDEKQKDHFRDDTKMVEQKPAEWSEKDEDKLEQCIKIVSGWEGDYDIVKSPYSNFLKSLRPSWKPSEEQMKALQNAVVLAAGNKVLAGLYEQLKKLM